MMAGFDLHALGRLTEATQPMKAAMDNAVMQKDWTNAAIQAVNMSELYLTIGDVKGSFDYGEQSVGLADKSGDWRMQMISRTVLGNSLHHAAYLANAQTTFHEAEELQKKNQPSFPFLYSVRSFQYCDLLLSQGNYAEVERRASQTLKWATRNDPLLDIALDNLSLGRAHLLQSQHEPNHPLIESLTYLNRAVDGLRQAGQQQYIPLGLLARATYYRVTGELDKVGKDLDEAFTIASRGGMGLHLADCHLENARLALGRGEKEKAREHWKTAKESIEKMGYHRRDREVEELEEQL